VLLHPAWIVPALSCRSKLFKQINSVPTLFEVVTGRAKLPQAMKPAGAAAAGGSKPAGAKRKQDGAMVSEQRPLQDSIAGKRAVQQAAVVCNSSSSIRQLPAAAPAAAKQHVQLHAAATEQ
jgi:hypothetical protein